MKTDGVVAADAWPKFLGPCRRTFAGVVYAAMLHFHHLCDGGVLDRDLLKNLDGILADRDDTQKDWANNVANVHAIACSGAGDFLAAKRFCSDLYRELIPL